MSGDVYWYWMPENLSPRVTPAFLARQRRILLPAQFAREHQNQWVDAADSITTAADVDWAMGQGWAETAAQEGDYGYEGFVDLGLTHDPNVAALGHQEGELLCLDRIQTSQGSRAHPVEFAAVEDTLLEWHARFNVQRSRIETWQGAGSVQRLAELGLPVEIMTPTARTNSEEWPALIQALASHRLILPEHPRLREELLNLTGELTPSGLRVIDKGRVHQDHAVAVRGVVAGLMMRPALELDRSTATPDSSGRGAALRAEAGAAGAGAGGSRRAGTERADLEAGAPLPAADSARGRGAGAGAAGARGAGAARAAIAMGRRGREVVGIAMESLPGRRRPGARFGAAGPAPRGHREWPPVLRVHPVVSEPGCWQPFAPGGAAGLAFLVERRTTMAMRRKPKAKRPELLKAKWPADFLICKNLKPAPAKTVATPESSAPDRAPKPTAKETL